ncbi:MAG: Peptidoglycan-associated lipoprotein [candidate division TM6 bacterium GW2011_GWF2_38_10]|nr:MAG: Peptidoglycan-associated lipoprotein [candidate division TM6 bacterium GW2011_GWF2_38_10]
MKKLALLCVICALAATGCGKKKTPKKDVTTRSSKSRSYIIQDPKSVKKGNKTVAINDFDFKDSEDFFDNEAISDFSFIDDESEKLASNDEPQLQELILTEKDTLPAQQNLAFAQNDEELEDILPEEEKVVTSNALAKHYAFDTIHFDINGNKIKKDQKALLANDCSLAHQAVQEGKEIIIQGHCCQLGSHSYNMALSQQRAQSIKKALVKKGIDANHIKTIGYGNEMPLVYSDTKDRAALVQELAPNRRAEIIIN